MEVLAEEGVRAVTHRRVAAESGASVGLVTYYFSTTESLIEATLAEIVTQEVAAFDRLRDAVVAAGNDFDEIIELLALEVEARGGPGKTLTAAGFALSLELARHERDRSIFSDWEDAQERLMAAVMRGVGAEPEYSYLWFLATALQGLFFNVIISAYPERIVQTARAGMRVALTAIRSETPLAARSTPEPRWDTRLRLQPPTPS